MCNRGRQKQTGFTIVELLIVIVVIAILAAIIIVAFNGVQNRAKTSTLKSDLKNAATQLEMAKVDNGGMYPADVDSLRKSNDTAYQYDSTGDTFCLTATSMSSDVGAFHVANGSGLQDGPCEGHADSTNGGGGVALNCPDGFVAVPGNSSFGTSDFCVMKYEAKDVGGNAVSQAVGKPWVDINQPDAEAAAQASCNGCHLITESEWLTIAHNILNIDSNWTGGTVGSGAVYAGYTSCPFAFYDIEMLPAGTDDANGYANTGVTSGSQRRTLTMNNGSVIWDLSANAAEWVAPQGTSVMPSPSDYEWYEWNALTDNGSVTPNPFPSYGTPAAASWGSDQGLGRVLSGGSGKDYIRSGSCIDWDVPGIFYLNYNYSPEYGSASVGFRAAMTP